MLSNPLFIIGAIVLILKLGLKHGLTILFILIFLYQLGASLTNK